MKPARAVKRYCTSPIMRLNTFCGNNSSKLQVRHSASSVNSKLNLFVPVAVKIRNLGLGPTSKDFEEQRQASQPLTKVHAAELVLHLKDEERKLLFDALQEYESNKIKEEFEGE